MVRAIIILPFFYVGGVERWALNLQKALNEKSIETRIFVLGKTDKKAKTIVKDSLGIETGIAALITYLVQRKKDQLRIITALTKLNFIFSALGFLLNKKVITSVHLSLAAKEGETRLKVAVRHLIHKIIIRTSAQVIAVSQGVADELAKISPKKANSIVRIYNPCFSSRDINVNRWPAKPSQPKIKLCAAGRLHPQKDFSLLLHAFALLPSAAKENCELTIYGEGEERCMLEELRRELGLDKFVNLPGVNHNLQSQFEESQIFILSSKYEGFGNVLVEALAAGCRCIAFDIPHGPKEILEGGRWGSLVKPRTAENMSKAIEREISACKVAATERVSKGQREDLSNWLMQFSVEGFSAQIPKLFHHD